MRKKRHSEEEIVRILRSAETSGIPLGEFIRKQGVSEQTFYRWRNKYGGLTESEASRLKELETENARLKKLVAERDLELDVMKEIVKKNW